MLSEAGSVFWSFADVEEALVDAAELWRRSPMTGFGPRGRGENFSCGGPFASDGPWHLLTRQARAGDQWEAWRVEIEDMAVQAARDKGAFAASEGYVSRGLSTAEVTRRDQVSEWLALVPEADRLLVVEAVWWQARTGRRIDWGRMLRALGLDYGKEGVRKRYNRAITGLAVHLTGKAVRLAA